ncbi:MAG: hypothetical protein KDD55_09340 [Bdellovibrionales bacterium]|nr:hypothetical protein [Bdellovibrionales bacterium]
MKYKRLVMRIALCFLILLIIPQSSFALTDLDGDGLNDEVERVLGTSEVLADSDGDGFSDSEEFARGSDMLVATSVPSSNATLSHVRIVGVQQNRNIRTHMVMFFPADVSEDRSLEQVTLDITSPSNALHRRRLWNSGNGQFQPEGITVRNAQGSMGADIVVVEKLLFNSRDEAVVLPLQGQYDFFAVAGVVSLDGIATVADSTNFANCGPIYLQSFELPVSSGLASEVGSVYRPIPGDGAVLPEDWEAGKICMSTSEYVGGSGAVITREVTSAECQDGWDSYCSNGCEGSVGQTYKTVDPLALIGG